MAWEHKLARDFARVLEHPNVEIVGSEPYTNDCGVPGWRHSCRFGGREFYVSQSNTDAPKPLGQIAKILSDGANIDASKPALYRNKSFGEGLRIEAWYCSKWYEVFTPDGCDDPADQFRELAVKIREDMSRPYHNRHSQ